MQWLEILSFRERRCAFSLDFWLFELSVLDGARSKVALRGKDYAWHLFGGVSTTPKDRDLFLLALIFG